MHQDRKCKFLIVNQCLNPILLTGSIAKPLLAACGQNCSRMSYDIVQTRTW